MVETRLKLSALWIALMLTYLLGDVLRIFSGDFVPGEMDGMPMTQGMLLAAAIFMLILSLTLPGNVNRWVNIGAAIILFLFNLVGLPTYPSVYDQFLIVVGLLFNGLTVWYAWRLPKLESGENRLGRARAGNRAAV